MLIATAAAVTITSMPPPHVTSGKTEMRAGVENSR
jgi:hypothetical protein